MEISFSEEADHDLAAIFALYNSKRPGLGYEFADEVNEALDRIQQMPHAWTLLKPGVRLCRTKRFPYGLIYRPGPDVCRIASIVHLHSDPETWSRS